MDADTPTFTLREVAAATGWHLGTMRDYFVRGVFQWHDGDGKAIVAGGTSKLSLRGAVRLAIAYQLWSQGVAPREAIKAATVFTDFGNAASSNSAGLTRLSGNLFPEGFETLLFWHKKEGARVVPMAVGEGIGLAMLGGSGAATIIHIDNAVEAVMGGLQGRRP